MRGQKKSSLLAGRFPFLRIIALAGLLTSLCEAQTQIQTPAEAARAGASHLVQLSLQCLEITQNEALAQEGFRAAAAADPAWSTPYFYLGILKERSKHWKEAADAYREFLQRESNTPRAKIVSAQMARFAGIADGQPVVGGDAMYRETVDGARFALSVGAFEEALRLAERAVALNPQGFEPHLLRAIAFRFLGRRDLSLNSLASAQKLASGGQTKELDELQLAIQGDLDAENKRKEASRLLQKNDFEAAFPLLSALVKRPDAQGPILEAYAYVAGALRQYSSASIVLKQKLESLPPQSKSEVEGLIRQLDASAATNEVAASKFAQAEQATSRPLSAFSPLMEALRLDPTNASYLTRFAQLAQKSGKNKSAVVAYQLALNLPGSPADKAGYVLALETDNNAVEAARVSEMLQSQAQDRGGEAMVDLAEAFLSRGLIKRAAPIVSKLVTQKPVSARVYHLYGLVLFDGKQYAEAEAALQASIAGDDKNSVVYADLAGALLREGKKDQAKMQALEAIKRNLKDHWVFREILGKGVKNN